MEGRRFVRGMVPNIVKTSLRCLHGAHEAVCIPALVHLGLAQSIAEVLTSDFDDGVVRLLTQLPGRLSVYDSVYLYIAS